MLQSRSCSSLKISSANFNPSNLITVSDKWNKCDTLQYTIVFTQFSIFSLVRQSILRCTRGTLLSLSWRYWGRPRKKTLWQPASWQRCPLDNCIRWSRLGHGWQIISIEPCSQYISMANYSYYDPPSTSFHKKNFKFIITILFSDAV